MDTFEPLNARLHDAERWCFTQQARAGWVTGLKLVSEGTRQNAERGGSPLVSFDHVIDPHFVTFSGSLYTTISNSNPNANPNTNPNPNHIPNPYPNHNPNRNPTVITDPQIDPIDLQIVTVQICATPHFVVFREWVSEWVSECECMYVPIHTVQVLISYETITATWSWATLVRPNVYRRLSHGRHVDLMHRPSPALRTTCHARWSRARDTDARLMSG